MTARNRSVVPPEGAEFLTVAQAAHLVQASVYTVREWIKTGKLRRYGGRGLFRVRRDELVTMLSCAPAEADEDRAAVVSILRRVGG